MLVDFKAPITGLDGKAVVGDGGAPMTLSTLAITALLTTLNEHGRAEELPPEEKVRMALLAQSIYLATSPLDLQAEEIALLKGRIGKTYTPLAVMRAWELLDPPAGTSP